MKKIKKVCYALLGYYYMLPVTLFAQRQLAPVTAVEQNGASQNSIQLGAEELMRKSVELATGSAVATSSSGLAASMADNYAFLISTLGMGGVAGWATGYTLKKVAKIAAIILGIIFISLQYLAFKQFITIDWTKIQNYFNGTVGNAGFFESFSAILTHNLPFAGSFIAGFWIGFKKG